MAPPPAVSAKRSGYPSALGDVRSALTSVRDIHTHSSRDFIAAAGMLRRISHRGNAGRAAMNPVDAYTFLRQLDFDGFVLLFWYIIVFDFSRYTLSIVAVLVETVMPKRKAPPLARLHSPEISRDIAQLAIRVADLEIRMIELYGNGRVLAAVPGTVAAIPAAQGGVVKEGEPVMEIMTGPRFILAYTNPGGFHRIERGDRVIASYGLRILEGEIDDILPISTKLPQEFQKAFRPKDRAQVIRIAIREEAQTQPLLTKVEVTSDSSLGA